MKHVTSNKKTIFAVLLCISATILSGCTISVSVSKPDTKETDGYYNITDDVEFRLFGQNSGTCWICASACSMMTAYQKEHDGTIVLDQMNLLNEIYDDDKEEGVFLAKGVNKAQFGGVGAFVINELSRGFGDGLVIDRAVDARGWTGDEIKDGIRTYGALYIGIPDTNSCKGNYDNCYTMNCPDPKPGEFDHSIAVLGWDDNFPKEYFNNEASENGAWITYNSNYPIDYYYVSYDTPFDQFLDPPLFMSVTDKYQKVLSYDCGMWHRDPVRTGAKTTTANVFKGEGTLAAVGTFILTDDQDITIQIMTSDLKECLYSQQCHADRAGYYVFDLNQPVEVDEYAIAITYPQGAPVEGDSMTLENVIHINVTSDSGQSFILIDGNWCDMSKKATRDRLGRVTNNACIKALYTR